MNGERPATMVVADGRRVRESPHRLPWRARDLSRGRGKRAPASRRRGRGRKPTCMSSRSKRCACVRPRARTNGERGADAPGRTESDSWQLATIARAKIARRTLFLGGGARHLSKSLGRASRVASPTRRRVAAMDAPTPMVPSAMKTTARCVRACATTAVDDRELPRPFVVSPRRSNLVVAFRRDPSSPPSPFPVEQRKRDDDLPEDRPSARRHHRPRLQERDDHLRAWAARCAVRTRVDSDQLQRLLMRSVRRVRHGGWRQRANTAAASRAASTSASVSSAPSDATSGAVSSWSPVAEGCAWMGSPSSRCETPSRAGARASSCATGRGPCARVSGTPCD